MNDNVIQKFVESIREPQVDNTTTYSAIVSKVDGEGVVWVNLTGSNIETPTASSSSEVKRGDIVYVQWRNNKLYIVGNDSNPSAGIGRIRDIETAANTAKEAANNAVADASRARQAAEEAEATAKGVESIAIAAETNAGKANDAAESAINGLSIVERVVDVVNWIAKHGTYKTTDDETPIEGKFYFVYDAETNTYSTVTPQEGDNPKANSWYELDSVEESVSNYVSSHLALVGNELHLQMDNTKVILSTTNGIELWKDGKKLASYGQNAVIGDEQGVHIKISSGSGEIGFYQGSVKVAYINGHKLYITKTVVLQQMDVGIPQSDGGLGQWSWKVHAINGQNNLYLKWNG